MSFANTITFILLVTLGLTASGAVHNAEAATAASACQTSAVGANAPLCTPVAPLPHAHMPSRSISPLLGSQAIHIPSPSTSQTIHINTSTCQDISTFKEVMKEYRKLDDSVTMRLNRNLAHFRDRDRGSVKSGNIATSQDEACAYFWSQLVAGWKARTEIVQYCVNVMDKGMEQTKTTFLTESRNVGDEDEAVSERRKRHQNAVLYAEGVKKNQIHNELTVEQIVRRRSLEAFRSRCKFFEPPLTDAEARKWWNAALSGQ